MSLTLSFDRLATEYPFLAWPRETMTSGKFGFLVPGGDDYNFCQIVRTVAFSYEDPLTDTLRRHLQAVENMLRFGRRHYGGNLDAHTLSEATCTGGILWWIERGLISFKPRLAVFRGRGLFYRASEPEHDLPHAQVWLSDVGLIPASAVCE